MIRPTHRFGDLLRSRTFLVAALVYLVAGFLLAWLPLTNYLGLEFSLAVGILAGLLGGPFAVAYFHRRTENVEIDAELDVADGIGASMLWLETTTLHAVAVLFSLGGLLVHSFFAPPCAPGRGLGFFLLLPLVSVAYASAWGLAFGSLLHRRRLAKILVVLAALGSLFLTAKTFLDRPTVWVYNPFFGYFPGPIYDAASTPELPLVVYRLGNLLQAWLVVLIASLFWRKRLLLEERRPAARGGVYVLILVLAAATLTIDHYRFELGFDMDQAHLQEKLDGHLATEHFDIYYPRRADLEAQIGLIALDHEFRFAQIERELGIAYPHRIASYLYPDPVTKKKLMGAAETQYGDCAKHTMHLNWEDFPHSTLHHEMLHIMLGDYGLPYLGFSWRMTVTEGLAVAFAGPDRWDMDLDRWAAGMKAIDRLPAVRDILGLRFWTESGARAYTAAGSFIRFLARQDDGLARLRAAYRWGDLAEHFDLSLAELETAWHAHLDELVPTLTPVEIERARYRFGFKSIFETRCPREVGRLGLEATTLQRQKYFHRADLLLQKAAALENDNPRVSALRLPLLVRLGRLEEVEELAAEIDTAQGSAAEPARDENGRLVGSRLIAQRAQLLAAGAKWLRGERDAAAAVYREIVTAELQDNLVRLAACALYALDHPELENGLRRYLVEAADESDRRWALLQTWPNDPDDPVVLYLLARQALNDKAYDAAAALLEQVVGQPDALPHWLLVEESWSALGYAYFLLGNYSCAEEAFLSLSDAQLRRGHRGLDAADWLARLAAWPELVKSSEQ